MSDNQKKPESCEGEQGGIDSGTIVSIDELEKIDWTDPKEWQKRITEAKQQRRSKPFETTITII